MGLLSFLRGGRPQLTQDDRNAIIAQAYTDLLDARRESGLSKTAIDSVCDVVYTVNGQQFHARVGFSLTASGRIETAEILEV